MRHHYLPVFYTKRWATSADGKLCEFSRPFGPKVKPRRVHPAGTCFVDGLYELKGLRPELVDQFEQLFMSPVDSGAARSLAIIEENDSSHVWSSGDRSAWTRFLMSLVMRMPGDVADLKALVEKEFSEYDPIAEERYQGLKLESDPPTFVEWIAQNDPHFVENSSFQIARSAIDHQRIGADVNNFHWRVFSTEGAVHELMTSDRPVLHAPSLGGPAAYILLPIGPRRVFAATRKTRPMQKLGALSANEMTALVNREVVEGANKYVLSSDDRQFRFVGNRMGSSQRSGWFARVRDLGADRAR